jgi:hypothetical protein
MKVTMPEMIKALWYLLLTEGTRIHKNNVVAIMEANEKERMLYTNWNCASDAGNIMVGNELGPMNGLP